MSRRLRASLVVLPVVAMAAIVSALASGRPWQVAVAVAACAAAGVAGLSLAAVGETVRWPPPLGPDRTSAGWHDVRILAEGLAEARADAGTRQRMIARIRLALDPASGAGGHPQAVGRRDYDRELARLRDHGAPR